MQASHSESTDNSTSRKLLPDLVRHPLTLLIAVALPQVILFFINLNAWHLISGEVSENQRSTAYYLFSGEVALFIIGLAVALFFYLKKRPSIPWGFYWITMIPGCVYLCLFAMFGFRVIPNSLQVWIVPPGSLVSSQFVCLMPATFLSALCLACFSTRFSILKDIGISAGVTVSIPAFWYVAAHSDFLFRGGNEFVEQFGLILFIISSLVCLTGIMRILTMTFNWVRNRGSIAQSIFIFLVAVAGPIGGLFLNKTTGFPADFQSPYIYWLAVGNGVALMVPKLANERWNRCAWFAQCLFFPFTLYFFVTFLPYLPLAVVAILAMGAGFLILVPTLLFIVHLKKLAEGATSKPLIVAGILVTLIVPVFLFVEAQLDRRAIHSAIDYVYSPNFESGDRFKGSRRSVKRSLERLNRIKKGRYLPFLTQTYNHIVLNNLVLGDTKLSHIYTSFFGENVPKVVAAKSTMWGRGNDRDRRNSRLASPPPKNASLVSVTNSESRADGLVRTLVKLELHNPSSVQSEFATDITIPDGMFVTGYWLHIGKERVPGQIFEKKTAMWVYRMIRDATRRDPGLLTWQGPNQLSLRVFPLARNETRITEIEFLSPEGFDRTITIGKEVIEPEVQSSEKIVTCQVDSSTASLTLNQSAIAGLPQTTRTPYLHFLIDRSTSGLDEADAIAEIKAVSAEFPDVKKCAISLVNYEIEDVADGQPFPLSEVDSQLPGVSLPLRGGFMMSRIVKRSLSRYDKNQSPECPVFVVLAGAKTKTLINEKPTWLAEALPDFDGLYIKGKNKKLKAIRFDGTGLSDKLIQQNVHLIKNGDIQKAFPVGEKSAFLILESADYLSVYDQDQQAFLPLRGLAVLDSSSLFGKATDGWAMSMQTTRNPADTNRLLSKLVAKSRQSGVLLPDTAYMVVENSAQWKILKQKEKKKLKGNHALDHMATPEPGWWMILLGYVLFLGVRRVRLRFVGA